MYELPDRTQSEERDADEAVSRDDNWFARQLGEEWRPDEPGIYRYMGPRRGADDRWSDDDLSDDFVPDRSDPRSNGDETTSAQTPVKRWLPWRKH